MEQAPIDQEPIEQDQLEQIEHRTKRTCRQGSAEHLGAVLYPDGTNFAIYSKYAMEIYLLLFDREDGEATDIIKLKSKTDNVWHVFVEGIKAGHMYGYKIRGEYNPKQGLRFNPHKFLIDPYSKALSGQYNIVDDRVFAYNTAAQGKDLEMDTRDNTSIMPKSVVVDDNFFDWQGDHRPNIACKDLIIYEAHVKGMTAHPTSGVNNPGTYLGLIEKIPYLKSLGINAVELLPVQSYYVQDHILKKGLTNYWGYDTIFFFAPSTFYRSGKSPGIELEEFKTLVRELHKAGMEVILDVVYNHTAEGNEFGPTLSFKGIDNPTYYYLCKGAEDEPYRFYRNDTGCGNTVNLENPAVQRMVLDSLHYWVNVMHIDAFRFDLATVLGRKEGEFNSASLFFETMGKDPILQKVKLIAEPWDLSTYQLGNFPKGWMEWNGRFRDNVRQFLKGDDGQAGEFARRLIGSKDFYEDKGRPLCESVNFLTCHDGFTLRDLFSYNEKHNESNKEDNRDGASDNRSWNCGAEGDTDDAAINRLRVQMAKNALCMLMCSYGTPMMLAGDEILRTQKGNNNTWCQDNELNWLNWDFTAEQRDVLAFLKEVMVLRKKYFVNVPTEEMPEIVWLDRKGQPPVWENPKLKTLGMFMKYAESPVYFMYNMHHLRSVMRLPEVEGYHWARVLDTSRQHVDDGASPGQPSPLPRQDACFIPARSIVVLSAVKN